MVNKQHQLKSRFRSLAGIILLFVVMITVIAVSPLTEASATDANYGEMKITEDFILTWATESTGNPDPGKHFRTIDWTFTVYGDFNGDGKTTSTEYKTVKNVSVSKINTSDNNYIMTYYWDLNDTSDKDAVNLKKYINQVEGDVTIKANPTVEFYNSSVSPESIYKTGITSKSVADSTAHKFFGNSKSYFDNYFNKNVEIEMVRIRVKTKAGDTDSYEGIDIDSTTIGGTSVGIDEEAAKNFSKKTKVTTSVWYALTDKATPKIVVQANDGYIFTGAESTTTVSVDMETTQYGNGSGKTGKLTTNTTVAVEATPVKVKIVYYVDEDGSGNYVKAGSVTGEYAHMDDGAITIGDGIDESICDLNYYTTWTYTDTKNNVERTYSTRYQIGNDELWTLWQRTGDRDVVTHTVNLYAESSNPPADSDYKIVYDGNGATSGSMTDQYATYGTTTMLKTNAYLKTGYHTDKDDTWVSENNSVTYAEAQSVSDSTLDFDDDDKTVV